MPRLRSSLLELDAAQPLSAIVDLTRGALSAQLQLPDEAPATINDFSISRIRQADKAELPTTGHLLSHNADELRESFTEIDTNHVLVLDDTSFSGTTSAVFERLLRKALPERAIEFTHGFLILNDGMLGERAGAKQHLEQLGSVAIGGTHMRTPHDDGWHFFDMIEQENFDAHIDTTMAFMQSPDHPPTLDELQLLFPGALTRDQLVSAQKSGHLITHTPLDGELHIRNPQLLPSIVEQGHLLPPQDWHDGQDITLKHLKTIHELLKEAHHE